MAGVSFGLFDAVLEASIRCKQHSSAVGALLKLQAQLTRLLEGS